MLVVSECAAALPIVERVGLVTGDLGVLGGECTAVYKSIGEVSPQMG